MVQYRAGHRLRHISEPVIAPLGSLRQAGAPVPVSSPPGHIPNWIFCALMGIARYRCLLAPIRSRSCHPMSAVFLYVLDPALEGISDERGAATLRASQHAHVTGSAVALDDGQALALD